MAVQQKKAKRVSQSTNDFQYTSYRLTKGSTIDRIAVGEIKKETFWNDYVRIRKPCVITGVVPGFDLDLFRIDRLNDSLEYDGQLQVEKKVAGGFGSGENRLKMKLAELTHRLLEGDHSLYLTTQYAEDDVANEDAIAEPHDDFSDDDSDSVEEGAEILSERDDDDDEEEGDSNVFGGGSADLASDNDSIDMDNLVDDFDELQDDLDSDDDDELDDDEIVDANCRGGPLKKSEALMRVRELLQQPLTNLTNGRIPIQPEILSYLIPQQINLWMGVTSPSGNSDFKVDVEDRETLGLGKAVPGEKACSSSGLHHDHADNLYIPVMGAKRFTLFSPENAPDLYTVGDVNNIFDSGIIDYKRNEKSPYWKHVNADGSMASELARWELENNKLLDRKQRSRLMKLIEQEEAVDGIEQAKEGSTKKDPPSFSKIPPALIHLDEIEDADTKELLKEFVQAKYPTLESCHSTSIYLNPGEMLYLPAGWFHEVTSYGGNGDENSNSRSRFHIAINYWFAPPDSTDKKRSYTTKYWEDDFERTLKSLDYVKKST